MRRPFTKDDIGTRGGNPVLNVKAYRLPRISQIAEHFKCSEAVAEKALQFSFESQQQSFWEDVQETAERIFGTHARVEQQGRSGGWLAVNGLPDIRYWDAVMLSKWRSFAKVIADDIAYRTSFATMRDDIEANQWADPDAEAYNLIDTPSGVKTVAEMKRAGRAAQDAFLNG